MRVLSYSDLISEKGIRFSKVWLWRLERDGKFPKRVKLAEKRYGWLADEIESWLKARSASRKEIAQAEKKQTRALAGAGLGRFIRPAGTLT